jgi:hypothetical protein
MKTYRVYFDQVNTTFIDVEATTIDDAMDKADKKWHDENGPRIRTVSLNNKIVYNEHDH